MTPSAREVSSELVARLPKGELHLHLEGSIEPRRLLDLAQRHRTDLADCTLQEIRRKVYRFDDFGQFLLRFKTVCEHLREPVDYESLLDDLVGRLLAQTVRYAEIICTPSIPWRFGGDGEAVVEALLERSRKLETEQPIKLRWIFDCVRQFGPEPAWRTVRLAEQNRGRGVVAIGLGGDEHSLPLADFQEVFAFARANALNAHVHAGEIGEPKQIWDAVKLLGAHRIGHGIQAARDPALMNYLRDHAIALDVCLTSNQLTGAWAPISRNPFWLLHKRGVPVTLNTDDPGLFQTTLVDEYLAAAKYFDLTFQDLSSIALQSVRSSFLPHREKMEMMQQFQDEISGLA